MNKVFLIGNLAKDPALSQVNQNISVCRFPIAINDIKDNVQFFNIVTWRAIAENCAKYLEKGKKVAIEGRIEIRQYEDKDGAKKTAVDIIANNVEFLSYANTTDLNTPPSDPANSYKKVYDDQLPF